MSDSSAAAKPEYDLRDWLVLALPIGCFVAAWTYLFLHASEGAFALCLGATLTNGGVFHFLAIKDDKIPDAK